MTKTGITLTRNSLLDGSFHDSLKSSIPPDIQVMDQIERNESVSSILFKAPNPLEIWVFAFGSLIWNPAFKFLEKRLVRIYGYHRKFCLWSKFGRGSLEHPGLMLSLQRGGCCTGVAYRLKPGTENIELDLIWRREMYTHAYRPTWIVAKSKDFSIPVITFTANLNHDRYAPNLNENEIVHFLATGSGPMGRCSDYLFETVNHLEKLGIRDRSLYRLSKLVRNQMEI
tara:strand:+ start:24 stop:704 length:681 start_codon:yes stop_codon:yes gene_type:complete